MDIYKVKNEDGYLTAHDAELLGKEIDDSDKKIMKRYEKALEFDTDTDIDQSNKKAEMPYHAYLYKVDASDQGERPLYYESVWWRFGVACANHSDKKILGSVIKDYIDGVNKLVLSFKSLFFDFLASHNMKSSEHHYYNEILINNIQIKGVYSDRASYPSAAVKMIVGGKFPVVAFHSGDYQDKTLSIKRLNSLRHFVDTGVFNHET